MEKSILHILMYFDQFDYPPTLDEAVLFFPRPVTRIEVERAAKNIPKIYRKGDRLALRSNVFREFNPKRSHSARYFRKAVDHLKWVEHLPQVKYLGISGSLSMLNMTKHGDIDIFVITKAHSIWQTRFLLLLYKYFLKLVKPDIGNKLCFNLFFSESGLKIQKNKQNEYIGHEILQLKPVINKKDIYHYFLKTNSWVLHLFPNVQINYISSDYYFEPSKQSAFQVFVEKSLQKLQVWWLNRKKISWKYQQGQLWLIQEDLEPKILNSI